MDLKPPSAKKSRAVLIASGKFTDATFTELDAVERTVKALKSQLGDHKVWGLSYGHCQVVEADECTREELLEIVREASQAAEDSFVLYFAGHGVNVKGRLLLPLPYSGAGESGTMLDFADLMKAADAGGARTKLALIDCCHAGLAMDALPFEQHVHGEVPEGCYVIAACEANRTAKSPQDHQFTAFGRALIRVLANDGPPDQEFWTPAQLFARVSELLTGGEYPQPVTNGAPVGQLPWVKNRGYDRFYVPADLSGPSAGDGSRRASEAVERVRYLGPDPSLLPTPFLGRDDLLREAGRRVQAGDVLPVTGRRLVGKSALLTALMAQADTLTRLPKPPVVLEIAPNSKAEKPLLNAIAQALRLTLDDSDLPAVADTRADSLLGLILPRQVKGRSLILVVKTQRFDLARPELARELDELLQQDVVKQATVIVETTDPFVLDEGRWRPQPFAVPELSTRDALSLIGDLLTREKLATDVTALDYVSDELVRRPGVIRPAVRLVASQQGQDDFDSLLAGRPIGGGAVREVVPGDVDEALMNVALSAIDGAWERAWSETGSADAAEAQALLTVWGVIEELSLPPDILLALGLPKSALSVLYREGVLVVGRSEAVPGTADEYRHFVEIGLVGREALRKDLLDKVSAATEPGAGQSLADLDRRLTTAARRLVAAVLPSGSPDGRPDSSSDEISRVVEALDRATGWLDRHVPDALAGLSHRLGLHVDGLTTDAPWTAVAQPIEPPTAEPASIPADIGDVVDSGDRGDGGDRGVTATVPAGPAAGAVQPWERAEELYAAAGRLALASRVPAKEANAGRTFLNLFDHAVSLLADRREVMPWQLLRSVDQSGLHGARGHRVLAETFPARVRLARQLAVRTADRTDVGLNDLLWSVSWALNTAGAQVAANDIDSVGDTLQLADRLIAMLPPPSDARAQQNQNWLHYRMARLRFTTAVTPEDRLAAALAAYNLARRNTLLSVSLPERLHRWTRNLLASGLTYAQEIRDDPERVALAETTMATLEEVWGPSDEWVTPLLTEVSRFLRRVHERHADSGLQYEGALKVLALLQPRNQGPGAGPAEPMDAAHRVELAEAHAFLAHVLLERNKPVEARRNLRKAVGIARQAAKDFPSSHTHRTWLRLLRVTEDWFGDGGGRKLLPDHARAVEEVRDWLAGGQEVRKGNQSMAQLHLWCLEADWRREGGLSAPQGSPGPQTPWKTGRTPEQTRMDKVYRNRTSALQSHESEYGATWALFDTRFALIREYQRFTAIHSRHPLEVDHTPIWDLLAEAEERFPRDRTRAKRIRASYHRYIWEYGEAARLYVEAAREETHGDRLRRALVEAAECLLSQALYEEGLTDEEREGVLRKASDLLQEVAPLHSQTHLVTVLSARIDLELHQRMDLDLAYSTFAKYLGNDYVGNSMPYLEELRQSESESAESAETPDASDDPDASESPDASDAPDTRAVDKVMEKYFTDGEVLRSLGGLFLRHAIINGERNPEVALDSAWRAYNCFDGRRVMETRFGSKEWVDTAFLRGHTITWAAELTDSASPFAAESGRQGGWLHLAEPLLDRARQRSAGGFHRLVWVWIRRLADLRSRLDGRTDGNPAGE
ncbi:caspase, EACC1-associated type [Streptomyces geranii]|uniref:caspase, EACC1-associated type n=1 Tax=Streptomyces geranii TaxID=2058923 RepID=UPI000D02392D|nr:caspase family protein [Streptomyces geranii]